MKRLDEIVEEAENKKVAHPSVAIAMANGNPLTLKKIPRHRMSESEAHKWAEARDGYCAGLLHICGEPYWYCYVVDRNDGI
ncbi:hypothetical protein DRH14_01825 [Candidatus Shapirobacteria bacterium]|nr:MAG: hypothetical protein DRH14_01825 [Candidatus Shapirobacteria bacterium]